MPLSQIVTNSLASIAATVPKGGTGVGTLAANNLLVGNGTSAVTLIAPGTSGQVLVSNGTTWAAGSAPAIGYESVTINTSGLTGTFNYDISTQQVVYVSTAQGANFSVNFRGNSTTTLNSLQANNTTYTCALAITNGSTAYYCTAVTIDGGAITPKWIGGAPTAGTANSISSYVFTLIKTADSTWGVIASLNAYI